MNTRKRPQQDCSLEPIPKKKRNGAPTNKQPEIIRVPDDEEPSTFHINVRLHSKFENFPPALRAILIRGYKDTILSQMEMLKTHKPLMLSYNYTLSVGECTKPGNEMIFHPSTTPRSPHLSIANTQLLEAFVVRFGTSFSKSSFVELVTEEGMANREFIDLHTGRDGEVSWGFDTNGCLSLYSARRENKVLRKVVYFIERTDRPVKVEID